MLNQVLTYFPAHTHPLTLVSDPDNLLADEVLWAALVARGFRIVRESEPFALRVAVQRCRPWSEAEPLIVVTAGSLDVLPYDLWQQGRRITLELQRFFPSLAYSLVRQLSPRQRARLASAMQATGAPTRILTEDETAAYVLRHVFGLPQAPALDVASLIVWLAEYHANGDPMPSDVTAYLIRQLHNTSALRTLPLSALMADPEVYRRAVQRGWERYVQRQTMNAEPSTQSPAEDAGSMLDFGTDVALQDVVPALVRRGIVHPVTVATGISVPEWVLPGVVRDAENAHLAAVAEGLTDIEQMLLGDELHWEEWQHLARRWAEVTRWRFDPALQPSADTISQYATLAARLDDRFASWLKTSYAPLAGRVLPIPHELHHIPQWLAYRRHLPEGRKPALLVLDGMSLADWLQLRDTWQARRPTWQMHESLVLAQVPSITAVSRLSLISGKRPDRFAPADLHNRREAQLWSAFWEENGITQGHAQYERLAGAGVYPAAIASYRTDAICLVSNAIDEMMHGSTQGASGLHAALDVWLRPSSDAGSAWLEGLLQRLLDRDFTVAITSDHGHVEAVGIGSLQEGILSGTRSKRARVYSPATLVQSARSRYPASICWEQEGLLPMDTSVLMPEGRGAFVTVGERVVSHGGLTLDEMVVPLITLAKK